MVERTFQVWVAALALWCAPCVASAAGKPMDNDGPPIVGIPSWVRSISAVGPDSSNRQLQYLLIDRQEQVNAKGQSLYTHFAMHLANQSAVDEESHVQINYVPTNEHILLHKIVIRRAGTVIDALPHAKISTLRREVDLDSRILDGALTFSIVLEDVRVGDVLEYAYTREVGDDGLNTSFSDWFTMQWSVPVKRSFLRVVYPRERNIRVKDSAAQKQVVAQQSLKSTELVWDTKDIAALPYDDETPGFVFQYPRVELSEYASWSQVADWAVPLYPRVEPSAEMHELIRQWKSESASTAEQIVRALRFVQDEVRYTGIEIGPGAYRPESPDVVLQRRFGDCKEKTYLLVTLLRAMGVVADPALVSTRHKEGVHELLPTPAIFDHVIARVDYEGAVYWFDATHALQGGTLDTVSQARYGAALVVTDAGHLELIPAEEVGPPTQDVLERFDLTSGALAKTTMEVESIYSGAQADNMRSFFAANTMEEVQRKYLNFYRDEFSTVGVAAPITVKDDRDGNRLTVREYYTLDSAFEKNQDSQKRYFEIDAHVIRAAAAAPKTIVRTSPLAIDHPTHVRYRTVVQLPEPWKVEQFDNHIDTGQFNYESSVHYAGNTLTAYYDFKTRVPFVSAAAVAEYAHKLDEVRKDAYYYLTYTPPNEAKRSGGLSYVMIAALALGCLLAVVIGRWLVRYDNPTFPKAPVLHAPEGLGGWMSLPTFGTVISPFVIAWALYTCRNYFDAAVWANLGSGQDPVIVHWCKIALFFGFAFVGALLPLSLLLAFLLFAKRRSFPPGFIVVQCMALAWELLSIIGTHGLHSNHDLAVHAGELTRTLLSAVIWALYMCRSERVRATFVNVAPPQASAAPAIQDPNLVS